MYVCVPITRMYTYPHCVFICFCFSLSMLRETLGTLKKKIVVYLEFRFSWCFIFHLTTMLLSLLAWAGIICSAHALTTVLPWMPLQVDTGLDLRVASCFMAMLSGHCWGHSWGSGPWSHHRVDLLPEHSETLEDPEEQTGPPGLTDSSPCPCSCITVRAHRGFNSLPVWPFTNLKGHSMSEYIFPNSVTSTNIFPSIVLILLLLVRFQVLCSMSLPYLFCWGCSLSSTYVCALSLASLVSCPFITPVCSEFKGES